MTRALVRFVCVAPGHSLSGGDPDGAVLTIVSGEWAFCPRVGTEPHVWQHTDGVDLASVRASRPRREPAEGRRALELR